MAMKGSAGTFTQSGEPGCPGPAGAGKSCPEALRGSGGGWSCAETPAGSQSHLGRRGCWRSCQGPLPAMSPVVPASLRQPPPPERGRQEPPAPGPGSARVSPTCECCCRLNWKNK